MISATEARKISNINIIIEIELKDIEKLVLEAAGIGRYSVGATIEDNVSEDVISILQKLGYHISKSTLPKYYIVNWEENT